MFYKLPHLNPITSLVASGVHRAGQILGVFQQKMSASVLCVAQSMGDKSHECLGAKTFLGFEVGVWGSGSEMLFSVTLYDSSGESKVTHLGICGTYCCCVVQECVYFALSGEVQTCYVGGAKSSKFRPLVPMRDATLQRKLN